MLAIFPLLFSYNFGISPLASVLIVKILDVVPNKLLAAIND